MSAAADVRRTDPRPALADVLAALTGESRGAWIAILREYVGLPRDLRWERDALVWGRPWQAQREGVRDPRVTRRGLTAATPAEAVEVLATRDLWPWAPGDDAAPRWWCERCQGCGWLPGWQHCGCVGEPEHEYGHTADPPTLAALVAVASLSVDTLRAAEGLALQLVGRAPRVVWRVMSREALRSHHEQTGRRWTNDGDDSAPVIFSSESTYEAKRADDAASGLLRTPPTGIWAPWGVDAPITTPRAVAAWPVLRDLAALSIHLVALDGDRITLAVEAI